MQTGARSLVPACAVLERVDQRVIEACKVLSERRGTRPGEDVLCFDPGGMDAEMCRRLVKQAEQHLLTVQSASGHQDYEGAFQLAYDACRKVCLSLVLTSTHRPTSTGGHAATSEAAAVIAGHLGLRQVVDEAADLRQVRRGAEYRAEELDNGDADDALEVAREVVEKLGEATLKVLAGRS